MMGVFYDSLLRSKGGKYYPISNLDSYDCTDLLPWLSNNCWYIENDRFFICTTEIMSSGEFLPCVWCISKLHNKGTHTYRIASIKEILPGESSVIIKFNEQNTYTVFIYDESINKMVSTDFYYLIDNEIQHNFEESILASSSICSIQNNYTTLLHLIGTTKPIQGTSALGNYNSYKLI